MNTTWMAASCVPMSSPLLGLLFFPRQEFTTLLVPRPRRVCLQKLRPRFVVTCLILRLTIATGSLTSVSIVSLGPVRGFLPFLISPIPTSYVAVSACHNLVRDVVHSAANDRASLGAILEKHGLLIPRDPSDDDRPPGRFLVSFSSTGLRLGSQGPVAVRRPGILHHQCSSSVESRKKASLNTASQCA